MTARPRNTAGVVFGHKFAKGQSGNPATQWRKGQSGNPKGRRKGAHDVKTLAKASTQEAVEKLKQLMRGAKSEMVQMQCSLALLDRAYGRPRQEMEIGPPSGPAEDMPEEMIDEAIDRIRRQLERARARGRAQEA